jgi:hypothetical protein
VAEQASSTVQLTRSRNAIKLFMARDRSAYLPAQPIGRLLGLEVDRVVARGTVAKAFIRLAEGVHDPKQERVVKAFDPQGRSRFYRQDPHAQERKRDVVGLSISEASIRSELSPR